jgi:hypothetical protein
MQIEVHLYSRENCSPDQVPEAASTKIQVNFQFHSCVCSLGAWNGCSWNVKTLRNVEEKKKTLTHVV